jgi:hypothetical protein
MEPLKRISHAEAKNYIELSIYDSKVCTQAIAYTLTDVMEGIYPEGVKPPSYGTAWQQVTYYADESSISNTSLSPLEFMYKEWEVNKDVNETRDWGDERESNTHSYL